MRKLIILLLVLGMTLMADAMTLQISVNGDPDPADSEIFLTPGDTAVLDIWSPDGYTGPYDDVYLVLAVDTTYGYICCGVVTPNAPCDSSFGPGTAQEAGIVPPPYDGIWGLIWCQVGTPAAPGVYIDEVFFRCESVGDAVVKLYTTTDFVYLTLVDSVVIHQIIPVPGDFEPDGDVDLHDFAVLALAWLSRPSDDNWNPACDISDPLDNVIDERDLAIFVENWLAGTP